ncbi:MAG: SDR family NAD(P)-dependent oxidoreductase, partial [Methylococcales bacterium]
MNPKIGLVTGASRGIGKAIALGLAAEGHTLIGTATTEQGADRISATLREAGRNGVGMKLDVCDAQAIDELVKSVTDRFGAPTILVN